MAETNSLTMETKSLSEKYNFAWKIHNLVRSAEEMESAAFTPLSNMKTQFSVLIRFRFQGNAWHGSVILKKLKEDEMTSHIQVEWDIKFIDAQGSSKIWKDSSAFLRCKELILITNSVPQLMYDRNNKWIAFKFHKEDYAILKINFKFFGHKATTKVITPFLTKSPQKNLSTLSADFKNIYNSKILTDITIRVDHTVFQAHQLVLIARSPVFKRMLESSFLESETKSLTITDVDFDIFDYFLKYLYSGDVEDKTFSTAYRLYSVADKYEVLSLQKECAEVLASNLNAENVCSVLKLSYLHSDKEFRDRAAYFVSTCFTEIKSNREWSHILKKYPELASEVLGSITAGYRI